LKHTIASIKAMYTRARKGPREAYCRKVWRKRRRKRRRKREGRGFGSTNAKQIPLIFVILLICIMICAIRIPHTNVIHSKLF
jgi:hypothetical protein